MKKKKLKIERFYYSFAYVGLLGLPALAILLQIKERLNFKSLALVIIICLIVGGVFDIWAVRQGKRDRFFIWEYNSKSILGFKVLGVPVEDYFLFLVLTPIFIVVIYEAVQLILLENETQLALILAFSIILLILSYYFVYKHAIESKK